MRSRYSCAWWSMSARSWLSSSRSRNCGTPALTVLMPASMRVRAARRFAIARRVSVSARSIAASAVRVAERAVIPKLAPSTATTRNVEPRKIFAARPSRTGLPSREPPFQLARRERSPLRDQGAGVIHLPPGIPQQHAAHAAALQVVDHAFAKRLLPVGERLEPRVGLADGLIAELEEVRVEEREVVIRLRLATHGTARRPAHGVRVVLVLHPEARFERRVVEVRDVARGVDVRLAGAAPLVHHDTVVDPQPRLLRQLHVRLNAEAGDDYIGRKLRVLGRAHDGLAGPRLEARQPLAHPQLHSLLPVVVHEEACQVGGEHPRAQSVLWDEHGHVAALQPQRGGDLRADEPATDDGEPHRRLGEPPQAPVVLAGPEVDHLLRLERQPPRRPTRREQELLVAMDRAAVVGNRLGARIDPDDPPTKLESGPGRLSLAPDARFRLAFPQGLGEGR